jgi:hypothetical protein
MKRQLPESSDAKLRRKRALAIFAKAKQNDVSGGADLVDYRDPTSAERIYGKSLESRAQQLLSGAKGARKSRKLAVSH